MSFESDIHSALENDAAIFAATSGRIHQDAAPADSDYPRLVWSIVSDVEIHDLDGRTTERRARVQASAYALDPVAAGVIQTAIDNALAALIVSTFGDSIVLESRQIFSRDTVEAAAGGNSIFGKQTDYQIHYRPV